jgi:hypothetical protein
LPACLQGPQLLIVVPTRELGVQLVMLVYRLYGGSVNQGVPGLAGNMFEFHGPRGLKVGGAGGGGGYGWVASALVQCPVQARLPSNCCRRPCD